MDSAVDDGMFQHEPLPDPNTHFRLLKIIQGGFDKHVVCELSVWSINEAPPYIAISYVWGDPTSVSTITIDSQPATVRTNCEYVLQQQASAPDTSQHYFWVDAICIDQKSPTEKNHQVALMGRLYSNAMRMHACIGPHYEDSQYLLEATGPTVPFFARLHNRIVVDHHSSINNVRRDWTTAVSNIQGRWFWVQCFLKMNAHTRKRLLQAFAALLNRPYFSRVWILQELFLGKDILLCCGQSRCPIAYMLAFNQLVDIWYGRTWVNYIGPRTLKDILFKSADAYGFPRRVYKSSPMFWDLSAFKARRGCLVLADNKLARYPVLVMLDALIEFECVDPRDRIYGALSLTAWKEGSAPLPDYSKEQFELAAETLATIMSQTQAILECLDPVSRKKLFTIAARLRTSLGYSPEKGSMRTAVEMRRQAPILSRPHSEQVNLSSRLKHLPAPRSVPHKVDDLGYPQVAVSESGWVDEDWQGVELSFGGSGKPGPIRVEVRPLDTHKERIPRLYCGDRLIAYGPPDTKQGDWILWHTSFPDFEWTPTIKNSAIAVTVRPLANGTYGLVGLVYLESKWMDARVMRKIRLHLKQFDIYWHAQDLLLMEWHHSTQREDDFSSRALSEWLKMRICIEEGSSFAQGPHVMLE
jgi:hypothetical protein